MLLSGSTYLDGDDATKDYHLHIIAFDQDKDGWVVVVSVQTLYRFSDKTVILKAGDHPFVRHPPMIAYNFARLQKLADIKSRLKLKPNLVRDPCGAPC